MKITRVNIYQHAGAWYYAAFTASGYDHDDTVDVSHDASEVEARTAITCMFPDALVNRVDDT